MQESRVRVSFRLHFTFPLEDYETIEVVQYMQRAKDNRALADLILSSVKKTIAEQKALEESPELYYLVFLNKTTQESIRLFTQTPLRGMVEARAKSIALVENLGYTISLGLWQTDSRNVETLEHPDFRLSLVPNEWRS